MFGISERQYVVFLVLKTPEWNYKCKPGETESSGLRL